MTIRLSHICYSCKIYYKNKKPNPFSNTISNILGIFLGANPNNNPNIGKKKST